MNHNQEKCINAALDILYAQLFNVADKMFKETVSDDEWALMLLAADQYHTTQKTPCDVALLVLSKACKKEGYFHDLVFSHKKMPLLNVDGLSMTKPIFPPQDPPKPK